jgi:hypothetical protein
VRSTSRAQAVLLGTGDLPVEPEELDAYELGLKSEFFEPEHDCSTSPVLLRLEDLQTFATIRASARLPEPARVDHSSARKSSGSSLRRRLALAAVARASGHRGHRMSARSVRMPRIEGAPMAAGAGVELQRRTCRRAFAMGDDTA